MRSWMERGGEGGGYNSLLTLKSRKARWDFTRKYLNEPAEFKKQTDLWTDTLPKKSHNIHLASPGEKTVSDR